MKIKLGQKIYRNIDFKVKEVDTENYTLKIVASTQDTDRHGDVIMQDGWDLKQYKKNPVILNSHRYDDATEVIAKATKTYIEGKGKKAKLVQEWKFAVDENPKAKIIFDLYAGGFLSACSVGFIVRKFKEDKNGVTDWFTIEEAELIEVSAVAVPANAMALAKAKGINVDELPDEMIDEEAEEDLDKDEPTEDDLEDIENDDEEVEESDEEEVKTTDDEPTENKSLEKARKLVDIATDVEVKKVEKKVVIKKKTQAEITADAIKSLNTKRRKSLNLLAKVVKDLTTEDNSGCDKETKKIEYRQVNKAIRNLIGQRNSLDKSFKRR